MKTIALFLVLAVAIASAQLGRGGNAFRGNAGRGAGGLNNLLGRLCFGRAVNYGPKVYGPGANNPCAIPPNPFMLRRAVTIANSAPGTLVFLDTDGEVSLTDNFGREASVFHPSGFDLTDLLEN